MAYASDARRSSGCGRWRAATMLGAFCLTEPHAG